ncbi:MAG: transglycosylase SLT domain-containing protein [Alphaproteobacteria bacterium]|nr:transglycosylase SLT domain-containing protein [Alphaproteobacteria bacterium]
MSTQERWDVVLRFLDGPLMYQGDVVCRGPVVRMGAKPGPGGLRVEGYRGLDDRQATITAYDGSTVAIAPVGANQVRVSTHANVDWNEILPISAPVYLDKDAVFHLGPPGRGATICFVECRRLGVWEQRQILSEASQVQPGVQPSNVRELDTGRGVPRWFIPAMAVGALAIAMGVLVPLIGEFQREINPLGPVDEGEEYYEFVTKEVLAEIPPELAEGINQPFHDFVMGPNAEAADWKQLAVRQDTWDQRYLTYVQGSMNQHLRAWAFWRRLEAIVDDYAAVVSILRETDLPLVLAAVPYQESGYRTDRTSPACAAGMWQLMPEVANRMELSVRGCKLRGSQSLWSPTALAPPINVYKNAEYIDDTQPFASKCRIQGCEIDERKDVVASTRAAVRLLAEAWNDDELRASGAAVQLTILSHNAGYDDSRFDPRGRVKKLNVLHAYRRWLEATNQERAPDFYGQNITCDSTQGEDMTCGGALHRETQHYAYNITAQHFLAVCYYAENYGGMGAFKDWNQYVRGEGYCTQLGVPTADEVRAKGGVKR